MYRNGSITLAVLALVAVIASGCTMFNPKTLTEPTPTPNAAFKYNLHTIATDAEGNETVNDGDTIEVDQTALKDNWSINLHRTYFDTTAMPREGMAAIGEVLKVHAQTGSSPSSEQLLLYAGAIQTVANYDIPLILADEQADVQRANDPEAFAAARVAQFQAAAEVSKHQTDAVKELAKDAISAVSPYAAGKSAFETLVTAVSSRNSGSGGSVTTTTTATVNEAPAVTPAETEASE